VTSIVFGLATAFVWASSSLMSSRAVKIISPWSVVAWSMMLGLLLTTPFVVATGVPEDLTADNVGWMVAAGAGNVTGLVLAAMAFRVGKVGVVTPILATEGAIAAVLAALLGESIAPIVGLILGAMVLGVVVAGAAPDPEPLDHERPGVAVALAVFAAFVFGIALFAVGHLSGDLPIPWVLLPARLVGTLALFLPLLVLRRLELTRRAAPLVAGMAVVEVLGFVLFALGAQEQVAVTSVLASLFAPIAAVLAFVLFRERLGRMQIVGVAILVVSVSGLSAVTSLA
jgi:drug/metabolite transporter (DMT)-like permease